MTAYDSAHKRVLWSDGEGITLADLNNMSIFRETMFLDGAWSGYRFEQATDLEKRYETPATGYCYVPRAGGFFPYCDSPGSTLVVALRRGWVFMRNPTQPAGGTPDGEIPLALAAFLDDNDALFTLSAGDGSNPRIDLIQIRLTQIDDDSANRDFEDATTRAKSTSAVDTVRRVQVDLSVKEGTPAADPSPPSPDSGYAEFARVRVDTSATSIDVDDLMDMRMPMRIEAQRVHPYMFGRPGTTPEWAISTGARISIAASGATDYAYMMPHTGVMAGRILGCWFNAAIVTASTSVFEIVRLNNSGTLAVQQMADLSSLMGFADATQKWHQKTGLVTGLASTNDNDQRPIWTNFYGPQEILTGNPLGSAVYQVGARFKGHATAEIFEGGFFVATDLW